MDEISNLMLWFVEQHKPNVIIDDYPKEKRERFCEIVLADTYKRVLGKLFLVHMKQKSNCTDRRGIKYPVYRHKLLSYSYRFGDEPQETWIALYNIYKDKDLMKNVYKCHCLGYKGKKRDKLSAVKTVRGISEECAKAALDGFSRCLNAKGQEAALRGLINFHIDTLTAFKLHSTTPREKKQQNISNCFKSI